ncbi:MAG: hypothetical protein JNK57_13805 [Planctomycetaceae bacterium]|nr:hypothetical protein [Planctomycetaceae bacterium]
MRKAAGQRPAAQSREQTAEPLSPAQELHRRTYYQAIQAGYNPAQAKAHADSVVQNAIAVQQQRQHPPQVQQAQQWEQQRVINQQQMAAAQQNARLWESIQRQRGVMAQPNQQNRMAAQRNSPSRPTQQMNVAGQGPQPNSAGPIVLSESEARGVRAASAQLAKMQARSERIETAVESAPSSTLVSPPARLVGNPRPGTASTIPRSVLEPAAELDLPGPQAAPGAMENTAGAPATAASENSSSAPTATGSPNAPRAPRKLPNVDPKPLQRPQSDLEVELEGFTDELLKGDGTDEPSPLPNQQVAYQEPMAAPSYARQDYVPSLGQGGNASTAPSQLVGPSLPAANVHGFAIEPVPHEAELPMPTGAASLNTQWDDQNPSVHVPPPTGIRVNPVSSGGRRAGSRRDYSQEELGIAAPQDDLEEVPLPRTTDETGTAEDGSDFGPGMKTCAELRQELLGVRLSDISLDLSTPVSTLPAGEVSAESREWRDAQGQVIATGRAVAINGQSVRIVENGGTERTIPFSNLSGKDQQMAWESIDLPFECEFLGMEAYCRSFAPTHVAWHASNLCHKPLYFEDIQLERYGHTVGPIKQPVKSAAKFLIQAALLPYQMALYPPNECQYPLGLFRPGNCAPYLRTPFPWERRAIGYQAGVATGVFMLVP